MNSQNIFCLVAVESEDAKTVCEFANKQCITIPVNAFSDFEKDGPLGIKKFASIQCSPVKRRAPLEDATNVPAEPVKLARYEDGTEIEDDLEAVAAQGKKLLQAGFDKDFIWTTYKTDLADSKREGQCIFDSYTSAESLFHQVRTVPFLLDSFGARGAAFIKEKSIPVPIWEDAPAQSFPAAVHENKETPLEVSMKAFGDKRFLDGLRVFKAKMEDHIKSVALMIAWSASHSYSAYDTLRTLLCFSKKEQFTINCFGSDESYPANHMMCVRALPDTQPTNRTIVPLFTTRAHLLKSPSDEIRREVSRWRDLLEQHLLDIKVPAKDIQFAINTHRNGFRPHSFVILFENTHTAAGVLQHSFSLEGVPFKITRVIHRLKRIQLIPGTISGIQLPVLEQIRKETTILRQQYRSFRFEFAVEKEYLTHSGALVAKEWSIRLTQVPISLESNGVTELLLDLLPEEILAEEECIVKSIYLDTNSMQPKADSIAAQHVRTWIVEFPVQSLAVAMLSDIKKFEADDKQVKIRRLGQPSNGGRFYFIPDIFRQAMELAHSAGNLVSPMQLPDGTLVPFTDIETLEFFDGTSVCAHSVAGGRIRFCSATLFQSKFLNPTEQQHYTKLLRFWDMSCGETQAFQGPKLFVTNDVKQQAEALFKGMLPDDFLWPETLTVADLRVLSLAFLDFYEMNHQTCGGSFPYAACTSPTLHWFIADGKGVGAITGGQGKMCGNCTEEKYEIDLYLGERRSQEHSHEMFQGLLNDLAMLVAYASASPVHKAECTKDTTYDELLSLLHKISCVLSEEQDLEGEASVLVSLQQKYADIRMLFGIKYFQEIDQTYSLVFDMHTATSQLETKGWLSSRDPTKLSKTRLQKLQVFLKRKANHITKEPVDFATIFRAWFPQSPIRRISPIFMHSIIKVNKRTAGIMHDLAQAWANEGSIEARKTMSRGQSAVVGAEILEADECLQGESMKTFFNGTKLRLLIDRGDAVFGGVVNFRGLRLLHLVKVVNKYVYSKANLEGEELSIRKHGLYAYTNTVWCLTGFLDQIRRKKRDQKVVTRSLHYHQFGEEFAHFYCEHGRSLVVFLEEDGEYYQMVSKALGKRSGNINFLDAMCTGEQIKDLQAMDYATGIRCDQKSRGRDSKLFSETCIPNLVVYACAYRLTPTWERNLRRLLWQILDKLQKNQELTKQTFVYESKACKEAHATWKTSDDYKYHLALYRERVASLYPEVKESIKYHGFVQHKNRMVLPELCVDANAPAFVDTAHYPHLQYPCLCQGCKTGFEGTPNRHDYGYIPSMVFNSCICSRLPAIVFLVGERDLGGSDKYLTVKWCEDTDLSVVPFTKDELTPLHTFILKAEIVYLEKFIFSLRWKQYNALLNTIRTASVSAVRNSSSSGTQVKEGDTVSVDGVFPEMTQVIVYFGDVVISDVRMNRDRTSFTFKCPAPQRTGSMVDITIVSKVEWKVFKVSHLLRKDKTRFQPLYLVEQDFTLRTFPKCLAYTSLRITKVVPPYFNTEGGAAEVHGRFVMANGETIEVQCGDIPCQVRSCTASKLSIVVPSGIGKNNRLQIEVKSTLTDTVLSRTSQPLISYSCPSVKSFVGPRGEFSDSDPFQCSTTGGQALMMRGSNFGDDSDAVSVFLGEKRCRVLSCDHETLEVAVPAGVGRFPTAYVRVGGQETVVTCPMKYFAPSMQDDDKCVQVGSTFKIRGVNFGDDPRQIVCLWMVEEHKQLRVGSASNTEIVCVTTGLKPGEGKVSTVVYNIPTPY
ncbi:hypothetical protein CYMTET_28052 [Cymbomonas tetramitiformis]|uniref:IPT/TIG domain-containing protein n=1 Tax=Cymbomonas tetramitiformis TaxID=36881 RepID=A0AAE0FNX8_9CHLO|nr:hypothetical protein CYMTET_28052 [Cymbomonas tetramitiformis]